MISTLIGLCNDDVELALFHAITEITLDESW